MEGKKASFGIELVAAVLLIAVAVAVVALVPMVECPSCQGNGSFAYVTTMATSMAIECPRCHARKKVTLMNKWFKDVPAPSRHGR